MKTINITKISIYSIHLKTIGCVHQVIQQEIYEDRSNKDPETTSSRGRVG